jgi:hypothetical protein
MSQLWAIEYFEKKAGFLGDALNTVRAAAQRGWGKPSGLAKKPGSPANAGVLAIANAYGKRNAGIQDPAAARARAMGNVFDSDRVKINSLLTPLTRSR